VTRLVISRVMGACRNTCPPHRANPTVRFSVAGADSGRVEIVEQFGFVRP
jgi:hypothetical protein